MDYILKSKFRRVAAYAILTLGLGGFLYMVFINLILIWDGKVASQPNANHATLEELAARNDGRRIGDAQTFQYLLIAGIVGAIACIGLILFLDWKLRKMKNPDGD